MAVEQEHFVHLARPLAPTALGFAAGSAPLTVNIQPQVCPTAHPLLPPLTLPNPNTDPTPFPAFLFFTPCHDTLDEHIPVLFGPKTLTVLTPY